MRTTVPRAASKLLVVSALLAGVLAAPSARADDPPAAADSAAEAKQQYTAGTQAFQGKRFAEAALHFESAAAFRAHAVTLYTAALAWDQAGRPERAADAYSRALDVPGLDAKQTANTRERVASLEKTLGTLAVTAPEGWKVQLDQLTEVSAPARLHGSPGAHTLNVRPPGKAIEHREVSLEAGQTTRLEVEDTPPPPAAPPPKKEEPKEDEPPPKVQPVRVEVHEPPIRRTLGFVAVGVGAAAIGSGIVLGIQALGAKDAYNAAPSREGFDHAGALATWTDVAFVAGTVFVVGGVALVFWPDSNKGEAKLAVSATPRGIHLGGSF